jgi:hypothetical protein
MLRVKHGVLQLPLKLLAVICCLQPVNFTLLLVNFTLEVPVSQELPCLTGTLSAMSRALCTPQPMYLH